MAAPTLAAQGTVAAVTSGDLTVTLPAHQANDILIVALAGWVPNTTGDAAAIAAPSGWTEIAQLATPATTPIDGRIAWFWRRATSSSETNPTFTRPSGWDTGTDTCWAGRAYVVRGCITTGNPWDEADPTVVYSTANQAFDAVTVSGAERTVIQFLNSQDDQSSGSAPSGWTAGTAATTTTGTDAGFQTFRKVNVSSDTGADATTVAAPAQGRYAFLGISFIPPSPTRGRISWAELEAPLAPTRGRLSWSEFETPLAPTRGRVSWAELEAPLAPTRGRASWAELEVPSPASPTRGRISFTEFEVPLVATRGRVSWSEFEAPLAPTRGRLSWAELEAPLAPTRGRASWMEFGIPAAATRGRLSLAEFEVPELGGGNRIYQPLLHVG
jgi:hypothetical protein